MITAVEASRIIEANKDAGGQPASWVSTAHPRTGDILRKHLLLGIAVDLLVIGDWRSPELIQIRLVLLLGKSEHNVVRLCLDPAHSGEVHWHMHEQVPGPHDIAIVSHPPATLTEATMFNDVFVPTMRIVNLPVSFL